QAHAAQGDDGRRARGVAAVRDADGGRSRAAPQVHRGKREVREEPRCLMAVIGVIAVLLIVLVWFLWPSTDAGPARRERPDVDAAELEAAERDVQEAAGWPPPSAMTARPLVRGSTRCTTPVRGAA